MKESEARLARKFKRQATEVTLGFEAELAAHLG